MGLRDDSQYVPLEWSNPLNRIQTSYTATYSNLENHPRIIRVANSKPTPKISLDPKTGFPLVNPLSNTTARKTVARFTNDAEDESDDTETESIGR